MPAGAGGLRTGLCGRRSVGHPVIRLAIVEDMGGGPVDGSSPAPPRLGRAGRDRSAALLRRVERLARTQHGVATITQMLDLGATKSWIRWRVSVGMLLVAEPGILRLADSPDSWESRAMSACLARGPSAVLSFASAARIWGLDVACRREARTEVTVSFTAGHRATEDVIIHRSRHLPQQDRTKLGPLPVTTVNRTIVDLAPRLRAAEIERLVDDSVLSGKTTVPLLLSSLSRSSHHGRTGPTAVRAALRPWLAGPLESHLEAEVLRLLLRSGLPAPTLQLEIRDRGRLVARVDFAWPDQQVILEVDGFRYHDGPARFTDDRHRANRLASLGWTVLATTQKEVRTDATALLEALRRRLHPAAGQARPN